MQERIIEIIVYMLSRMQQERKINEYLNLSSELEKLGYTEYEVNLAFSWIFNHLQSAPEDIRDQVQLDTGFDDMYEETTNINITAEAYGYLMQLLHLGVISDMQLEEVMDRASEMENDNITSDDVKSIVSNIIFDSQKFNTAYNSFFFNRGSDNIQ